MNAAIRLAFASEPWASSTRRPLAFRFEPTRATSDPPIDAPAPTRGFAAGPAAIQSLISRAGPGDGARVPGSAAGGGRRDRRDPAPTPLATSTSTATLLASPLRVPSHRAGELPSLSLVGRRPANAASSAAADRLREEGRENRERGAGDAFLERLRALRSLGVLLMGAVWDRHTDFLDTRPRPSVLRALLTAADDAILRWSEREAIRRAKHPPPPPTTTILESHSIASLVESHRSRSISPEDAALAALASISPASHSPSPPPTSPAPLLPPIPPPPATLLAPRAFAPASSRADPSGSPPRLKASLSAPIGLHYPSLTRPVTPGSLLAATPSAPGGSRTGSKVVVTAGAHLPSPLGFTPIRGRTAAHEPRGVSPPSPVRFAPRIHVSPELRSLVGHIRRGRGEDAFGPFRGHGDEPFIDDSPRFLEDLSASPWHHGSQTLHDGSSSSSAAASSTAGPTAGSGFDDGGPTSAEARDPDGPLISPDFRQWLADNGVGPPISPTLVEGAGVGEGTGASTGLGGSGGASATGAAPRAPPDVWILSSRRPETPGFPHAPRGGPSSTHTDSRANIDARAPVGTTSAHQGGAPRASTTASRRTGHTSSSSSSAAGGAFSLTALPLVGGGSVVSTTIPGSLGGSSVAWGTASTSALPEGAVAIPPVVISSASVPWPAAHRLVGGLPVGHKAGRPGHFKLGAEGPSRRSEPRGQRSTGQGLPKGVDWMGSFR